MDDVQSYNSMISSNNNYFKSSKSINELVLRLGQKSFEEIHIVCQHRDAKHKIPRSNPFLIQADIKKHINRHDNITNMKFSRQGKLIFSTADPVCAAQILNLDKILETPISTAVTFENISERFLVFDIPTNLPLSELAAEIMHKNDMEVVELRRFVKLNSTQEFSPYSKDANFYFWGFQPTPPLLGRKNIYAQKRRIFGLVESVAFFYPEYFNAHSHHP
ncbi:uncharacterized protein CEXT_531971 [Caerostris extrusa]|uniref:Uncharacterized protein n=1 Tax=Caerostris extrusa TaxID=172846 RepID=A0AAV4RPN8_CAEEX|nr:uncharacterized protein CEXT_531971 [Caerostris extrusa]